MKKTLLIVLLAGLGTASTYAQTAGGPNKFDAIDKNNDGKISSAEASQTGKRKFIKRFPKIDANSDGFITKEEITAYRTKYKKNKVLP